MTRGLVFLAIAALAVSISTSAQTTTTTTTPPATTKPAPKPKPARKNARQAAAQPIPAVPASSNAATTSMAPAAMMQQAATAEPASAAAPMSATGATHSTASTQAAAPAADRGTLSWATRVYSPTSCVHNGTHAVCTFTFVNQGNGANLIAGGAGELSGVMLVDDAHVPHRWDGAYFMDKYGSQQRRLFVEKGDTGTYLVTFPNVDPRVSSAEFHLRNQVIGGINVTPPAGQVAPAAPANK